MISTAGQVDLPELARLMAEAPLQQRYGVNYTDALAWLSGAADDGDLLVCSRAAAGDVEGFAWLTFGPRILNGAAYLRLLLVARPSRGVGSQLLLAVEEAARARSNHLYLLVTTDNLRARRFYEQRGYRHVGDLPGLVLAELDEALYHKALRASDRP